MSYSGDGNGPGTAASTATPIIATAETDHLWGLTLGMTEELVATMAIGSSLGPQEPSGSAAPMSIVERGALWRVLRPMPLVRLAWPPAAFAPEGIGLLLNAVIFGTCRVVAMASDARFRWMLRSTQQPKAT
jgi:hypothetical protein